jgi:hypothetical protein
MDADKEKTKGEEIHEEIQRIRYGCCICNGFVEWLLEAEK